MHLRKPRFTYSTCGPFTKNKERMQEIQLMFIKKKLDKACIQYDMLMEILNIYLEERLLLKYYIIKHLILIKIQNMTI